VRQIGDDEFAGCQRTDRGECDREDEFHGVSINNGAALKTPGNPAFLGDADLAGDLSGADAPKA
jgi:hypothetical protein